MDRTEYQRGGNTAQISKTHAALEIFSAAIALSQASEEKKTTNKQKNLLPLGDKVKIGNTEDQAVNRKLLRSNLTEKIKKKKILEEIPLLLGNAKFIEIS